MFCPSIFRFAQFYTLFFHFQLNSFILSSCPRYQHFAGFLSIRFTFCFQNEASRIPQNAVLITPVKGKRTLNWARDHDIETFIWKHFLSADFRSIWKNLWNLRSFLIMFENKMFAWRFMPRLLTFSAFATLIYANWRNLFSNEFIFGRFSIVFILVGVIRGWTFRVSSAKQCTMRKHLKKRKHLQNI